MGANDGAATELHDDQQVRVVRRLRAAGGGPLDFDELRGMGIEHPAVLCYELEIAGVPIVQTRREDRRMLALDTRAEQLTPDHDESHGGDTLARLPDPGAAAAAARARMEPARRRARALLAAGNARRGVVASWLALAAVVVAVLVIVLSGQPGVFHGGAGLRRAQSSTVPASRTAAGSQRTSSATPSRVASTGRRTGPGAAARAPRVPVDVSPATASKLDLEGHRLLAEGRYAAAIDVLQGALRASGQSPARCAQPTTEACLTFAYALYDLGRALRLNGNPRAAIPVLNRRLGIDNQRSVVRHELELARGATA
jgi:tetratricopeptide (TPR) repeat protein